jgi:hypothetical protein
MKKKGAGKAGFSIQGRGYIKFPSLSAEGKQCAGFFHQQSGGSHLIRYLI